MATALWIAHVMVTDPVAYADYAARAGVAIAAHGGVFLARGGRYVQLEGSDRPEMSWPGFPALNGRWNAITHPPIKRRSALQKVQPCGI